jgi:hypothetical protein
MGKAYGLDMEGKERGLVAAAHYGGLRSTPLDTDDDYWEALQGSPIGYRHTVPCVLYILLARRLEAAMLDASHLCGSSELRA